MEDRFWELIDQVRARGNSCSEHGRELERVLSRLSPAEIETFARDQETLMRTSYRWDLWGAAFVIKGGCSDDGFDYFRGWLVLQGREVWNAALRDPESLAEVPLDGEAECEDILYAASKAFESATGQSLPPRGDPYPSEPAGTAWAEAELETIYPRLSKRLIAEPAEQVYRVRHVVDEWDRQMESGMTLLASGAFEPAARVFAAVRKSAPRPLTRTIAANNLAWTDLMIDTPAAVRDALKLANEAMKMIEGEPQNSAHLAGIRGTLAFALIENNQVEAGLSLIKYVLATDASGPQFLALRLCVQAIGLARSGDFAGARALTARARKTDPRCQLLSRARSMVASFSAPAPPELRHLSPLLEQFGVQDDAQRERAIRTASSEQLMALVKAVDKQAFDQINRYLDETDDAEDAVPYGDLAQAAMEAKRELKGRGFPEV